MTWNDIAGFHCSDGSHASIDVLSQWQVDQVDADAFLGTWFNLNHLGSDTSETLMPWRLPPPTMYDDWWTNQWMIDQIMINIPLFGEIQNPLVIRVKWSWTMIGVWNCLVYGCVWKWGIRNMCMFIGDCCYTCRESWYSNANIHRKLGSLEMKKYTSIYTYIHNL